METDLPVKEIMTREVCVGGKDESLLNASRRMLEYGVGSIVVVEDGKPVGIVTERDILEKVVSRNRVPSEVSLGDIMSYPVITIKPTYSLREAAKIMLKRGIRRLPVVDGDKLLGIVTDTDILTVSLDLGEFMGLITDRFYEVEEEIGGKCERCGKFTEDLYDFQGMKVCEDCYESE